jgi:phosphatidylethanolamine/phosphatidyl-N-methylethanolamine N-methyltransferase
LATLTNPPAPKTQGHRERGPLVGRNNRTKLGARAAFLKEFIKAPHVMAAVAPSSRKLGHAMVQGLELSRARTIVEYGPGTGTFTRAVLEEIGADWFASALTDSIGGAAAPTRRFIAIEFNKAMARLLQEQHPEVTVVPDSAEHVEAICAARNVRVGEVDFVLSGLGWPSFDDEFRIRTLEATARVLRPGGEFRTFGYHVGLLMRGAWHFRSEVRRLFRQVEIGRVVWGNMPPAFVYRCIK